MSEFERTLGEAWAVWTASELALGDKAAKTVFGTLTFRDFVDHIGDAHPPGIFRVRRAVDSYLAGVAQWLAGYLVVVERGDGGRLHCHFVGVLEGTLSSDTLALLRSGWTQGHEKIQISRSADAAIQYVVKYCCKDTTLGSDFWLKRVPSQLRRVD